MSIVKSIAPALLAVITGSTVFADTAEGYGLLISKEEIKAGSTTGGVSASTHSTVFPARSISDCHAVAFAAASSVDSANVVCMLPDKEPEAIICYSRSNDIKCKKLSIPALQGQ